MRQIFTALSFSALLTLAGCAAKSTTAASCPSGAKGCDCTAQQVAAEKDCHCKTGEKCGCEKGKCSCKKS